MPAPEGPMIADASPDFHCVCVDGVGGVGGGSSVGGDGVGGGGVCWRVRAARYARHELALSVDRGGSGERVCRLESGDEGRAVGERKKPLRCVSRRCRRGR